MLRSRHAEVRAKRASKHAPNFQQDKTMTFKLLLTPGDGIGPEVIADTRRVVGWFAQNRNIAFETEEAAIGGIADESLRTPQPDATIAKAKKADAVLFGAVG